MGDIDCSEADSVLWADSDYVNWTWLGVILLFN
jgi:hypothetical protein